MFRKPTESALKLRVVFLNGDINIDINSNDKTHYEYINLLNGYGFYFLY